MQSGDVIDLEVDALSFGGEGIARHSGLVIFVPRGLPGDRVRVRIVHLKKRYCSSRIERILTPSPHRVEPGCTLFEAGGGPHLGCGGCQWLHFAYREQSSWKRRFVEDALKRIGGLEVEVAPTRAAAAASASRNKLSATLGANGKLGLCIEHSPEVLTITSCPMEVNANNLALEAIQAHLAGPSGTALRELVTQVHLRSSPDGRVSLCFYAEQSSELLGVLARDLVARKLIVAAGVAMRRGYAHLAGARSLSVRMSRIEYEVPMDAFFQTNYPGAEMLLGLVREFLGALPGERLLDLYAGVGFFALDFALDGAKITAVEGHPAALAAAGRTARRLGLDGRFVRARVDPELFARPEIEKRYDRIVLDPPRGGCGPEVAGAISRLGAKRIVYVSCSPDTLARDLKVICAGGYRVVECVPIDMFPQTYHVEVVTALEAVRG